MDLLQIIMMIINVLALISLGVGYFKSKFVIIDLETWNTVAEFYSEHAEDIEDAPVSGGGCGFFMDQLVDEEELVDPEEEPQEDDD